MEPKRIEWLADWDRHVDPARQRDYVLQELERLRASGAPLLLTALTAPFVEQQDLAVSVLRRDMGVSSVMLRLTSDAVVRDIDPCGRPMPKDLAGRVFRVGLGPRGGAKEGQPPPSEIEAVRYSGPARDALYRAGKIQHTLDITREPQHVAIEDAIPLLRKWGLGVSAERWRRRGREVGAEVRGVKLERDGRVDLWPIEEVTQAMLDEERTRPAAKSTKAA